jgi:hypothetical protein
MVKFIKAILVGCETQSLIAVLTLYGGFHTFSTTTLISFPPAKETIYSTLHPKQGMHSWRLLAEGKGGVLGKQPGRQWGQEDCVARASQVIFVKPECVRNFSLLMDFQPAEGHAQWRDESQTTVLSLFAGHREK